MFNLVFCVFITATICNKVYASELFTNIKWYDSSNDTSANVSLSPKRPTLDTPPTRSRKRRSVQYVDLADQLERAGRHQSPRSRSHSHSSQSERNSMSQDSSPMMYMLKELSRVASGSPSSPSTSTDQSLLSSGASVFRTKPDILEWNDPIESDTKGLIENDASNAVDSLRKAQTILPDINVTKPIEIVDKKLFQKFGNIIASTTGMIKLMECQGTRNSSLKHDAAVLLSSVHWYKDRVEKIAGNIQAWKYYFVHLYANFTIHDTNNNSDNNNHHQLEISAQDLAGFLEESPDPLNGIKRRRSSPGFHLSGEMLESVEMSSYDSGDTGDTRDTRDTRESINTPLVPQTAPFPLNALSPVIETNAVKASKDTTNITNISNIVNITNVTNVTNVTKNETPPKRHANNVFLFSLKFDCVNYMFHRNFYQLMKGLFEYQTFVNKIIDDRKQDLIQENTRVYQSPMTKLNELDRNRFNMATNNSSFRIDIAITTPNHSTSTLNIRTRGLASKLNIRNMVLEHREMEDSLIEYYASDVYARKVVRFGQWIESMYTTSNFYDEKKFEANKGNYDEYSMIKLKPNNVTDWVLYVVNTNLEFERQLKNRTIFEMPLLLSRFPKLNVH